MAKIFQHLLYLLCSCLILFTACGQNQQFENTPTKVEPVIQSSASDSYGTRPAKAIVLEPLSTGEQQKVCPVAIIDYSNCNKGYVMANYSGNVSKVKLQVKCPDTLTYTYTLNGGWEVFPLTDGNGSYTINIYENISGNEYSTALSVQISVALENEFLPFLYPNQYVNFNKDTKLIEKGEELAKESSSDLDFIDKVYNYVINTLEYDYEKAKTVKSGYTPCVDEIMEYKKGICFDYSAVIATMLRTQAIPTRMEFGYAGEIYHAWISIYIKDKGWIDGTIQFDGKNWKRMDPTFADTDKKSKKIMKFIDSDSNYTTKYRY
ncbi:MAG: transglutaminase-like domain-containing protein [Oscillospiraceae bacterium]